MILAISRRDDLRTRADKPSGPVELVFRSLSAAVTLAVEDWLVWWCCCDITVVADVWLLSITPYAVKACVERIR